MEQAFIGILEQLVKEQGSAALTDARKCKSLLADYTKNDYKKESRLLIQAVEAGVAKSIEGAEDLALCKKTQIRNMEEEGLSSSFAQDIVNALALVLRGDKTVTVAASVQQTAAPIASKVSAPPEKNADTCDVRYYDMLNNTTKVLIKYVSKIYKSGVRAVDNVYFNVEDKEFAVLLGPSGSGKTTLLNMIAGYENITEGELLIDGEIMNDFSPNGRNVAMTANDYGVDTAGGSSKSRLDRGALSLQMTVYENMAFVLQSKKVPKYEIDKRIHEAARILDFEKFLGYKIAALSAGQRCRVAVGRAIVRNPKVFLFDDILSTLDPKLRVQMRAELSDLHLRLNATIIYATVDWAEAMSMANKIIVIKDGIVQQIGSPLFLYYYPVNKFVAGYMGSPPMYLLNVKVQEESNSIVLDEGSFKIKADGAHIAYLRKYAGKEVLLGIRPEDLIYTESPDRGIRTRVTVVQPFGADIHLWLTTDTQPLMARTEPYHIFRVGDTANFIPKMEKARYFDKETELAIIPPPGV
jgi:multiple sugar transport system ATP-binding protein